MGGVQSLSGRHRDALRGIHRRDDAFKGFLLDVLDEEVHALRGRLDGANGPCRSRSIVAASRPTGTSALGTRPRRISAAVLAVGNTQIGVVWLVLHSINGFDGVRDVREVNESTVPDSGCQDTGPERHVGYSLLLEEVDELDITVLAEVPLQLLVVESIEVLDITDINVAGSTAMHSESKGRRKRAGVLAPANLEATVVQRQTLVGCDLEEGKRGSRVDERDELPISSASAHQGPKSSLDLQQCACPACSACSAKHHLGWRCTGPPW